jgi:hypothetical protein
MSVQGYYAPRRMSTPSAHELQVPITESTTVRCSMRRFWRSIRYRSAQKTSSTQILSYAPSGNPSGLDFVATSATIMDRNTLGSETLLAEGTCISSCGAGGETRSHLPLEPVMELDEERPVFSAEVVARQRFIDARRLVTRRSAGMGTKIDIEASGHRDQYEGAVLSTR